MISNKRPRADSEASTMDVAVAEVGDGLQVTPHRPFRSWQNKLTVELPYSSVYQVNISTSSQNARLWRMTSIWDPDYSGTGHQPYQRDTWANMYAYYAVIKCDYEFSITNTNPKDSTDQNTGGAYTNSNWVLATRRITTQPGLLTTASASTDDMFEEKYAENLVIPPGETRTFKGSLTQGDFIKNVVDEDTDNTWVAVGSNPAVDRVLGINLQRMFPASTGESKTTINIMTHTKLVYTVQFADYYFKQVGS